MCTRVGLWAVKLYMLDIVGCMVGLMRTRDVDQIDLDCCPDDNVADIPCQIVGLVIKDASSDNKSDSGGANAGSVSKSIN